MFLLDLRKSAFLLLNRQKHEEKMCGPVTSQQTQISGLGTRVSNTESSITQQAHQIESKVSLTDVTGNTVVSKINQTATTISIQASKINLIGAVNVLSDITGNLGTITSGNIDIYNDVKIGNDLYLRGFGGNAIIFGEGSRLVSNSGNLDLMTNNNLSIQSQNTTFYGASVDFSNVGFINELAKGHTPGIGIACSPAARLIWFRVNGVDVGSVKLT